jgi:predicted DNA-binding protein with PD1-like motif
MNARLLSEDGMRTWALVFDAGDEVKEGLERFAAEQRLSAARFSAIGALSDVVLGYFDWERKET